MYSPETAWNAPVSGSSTTPVSLSIAKSTRSRSVAAALVAAVWVGAWPFVLLPEMAWTIAIVVGFSFSAIAHKYYTAQMNVGQTEKPPEVE